MGAQSKGPTTKPRTKPGMKSVLDMQGTGLKDLPEVTITYTWVAYGPNVSWMDLVAAELLFSYHRSDEIRVTYRVEEAMATARVETATSMITDHLYVLPQVMGFSASPSGIQSTMKGFASVPSPSYL